MGIARLAIIGAAVVLLLALVGVGVFALLSSLDSEGSESAPTPTTSQAVPPSPNQVVSATGARTLLIKCVAAQCPVFVRVPGGDVLMSGDLVEGQEIAYDQPKLAVVFEDGGTVEVYVNGKKRARGKPGERLSFTAERS
ncbi:DUF4115 domain-containing protein [Rhizohabitans arisaemae]|uniref:DUF4115 domain-containing protein n=1 Tax=Rhizohabitans arisaemae TaxID=2720610 RepID=UPI0024B28579|nr:DUF4115 domain-containing protein [Rhizohabitans arisaemae]